MPSVLWGVDSHYIQGKGRKEVWPSGEEEAEAMKNLDIIWKCVCEPKIALFVWQRLYSHHQTNYLWEYTLQKVMALSIKVGP